MNCFGLQPGDLVVLNDGASCPHSLLGALSDEAAAVEGVRLFLGWTPLDLAGLRFEAFERVVTMLAGYSLRAPVDRGAVDYLPIRLANVPALFRSSMRPAVVVASLAASVDGHRFASDVGYLRAAVAAGARVVGVERPRVPALDHAEPLPADRLTVTGSDDSELPEIAWAAPNDVQREIGRQVAALIPEGSRVQFGPGPLGAATFDALTRPVRVHTGIVTETVMDLDRRGLLVDRAVAPYVAGTAEMYAWAADHVHARGVEYTHSPAVLAADPPLVAVNTALEVDIDGQVNVESVGGSALAGIGGHADFAAGAAYNPGGLSIVAVPTMRGRHPTLVDRLGAPVSTTSTDVDLIVTELGVADLRGKSRHDRRAVIGAIWP